MKPNRASNPWRPSRRAGRTRWAGLLLLVVGVLTVVSPTPASAHDVDLGGSTPSADEVVRTAEVIELRFTGPVRTEGATFTLRGLSG
ncbi:hypothetical protein [Microlunatus antarcticus]|uniref:Methionine-rich copper-binding protein CopC n=1 Tax=Microlunatus antarcticus TaxID=53388 RepID=A0A7W5JVF0_9ACTN|nr:hypothetical protein [Microlunatus antarcticus]MBB3326958.1 methionine-rich copper-binding protein CopC [Microlunatus antarcticus]